MTKVNAITRVHSDEEFEQMREARDQANGRAETAERELAAANAEACVIEGFRCVGSERDLQYLPLIVSRLSKPISPVLGFGDAS